MLGDGRQDVNREAVGLREIDGVKLHPGGRAAGVLFAVLAQALAGSRVWAGSIRALRTFP